MRYTTKLLHILIVLALPLALFAASLRLTTHHWIVEWEYGKADFPPDPFGMPTAERVRLARVCVDYLVTGADIRLLAELRLDGQPAFNARELQHMVDVKRVLWILLGAGGLAGVVAVGGTAALAARRPTRTHAPTALLGGSLLTLGLLASVGLLMLTRWDNFFVGFHRLFFSGDSWLFAYSDTLIRLYPERFWMDVGMVIVGLLAGLALLSAGTSLIWHRLQLRTPTSKAPSP